MNKVLVIAAHPDDEVLGCGATIARLAKQEVEVSIMILAQGLTSRRAFDARTVKKALALHQDRAEKAAKVLGARHVSFSGLPDQKMDTIALLDITHRIEAEIDRLCPDTIFTHHGGDLNYDHVLTFRATLTATRPTAAVPERVYAYEVPSSTEWSFQRFSPVFEPNVFYDISDTLETKIRAMQVYETETRKFPHPRSPEVLRAIAHRWGSVVGKSAAEAFQVVREII